MGGTNFNLLVVLAPCPLSAATWAQNVSTKIPLKTRSGIPRHPYPRSHRLPSFLSPSPPASSLLQGSQWQLAACASRWGRFQSFGFAVHVFVSAVDVVWVCLSSPCAVSAHLVCLALAVSPYGAEEAEMRCVCSVRGSTDPACPAAVLTHLAFPAAFPRLPGTPAFFQVTVPAKQQNSNTRMFHCQVLVLHTTSK